MTATIYTHIKLLKPVAIKYRQTKDDIILTHLLDFWDSLDDIDAATFEHYIVKPYLF